MARRPPLGFLVMAGVMARRPPLGFLVMAGVMARRPLSASWSWLG